jgi:conjugative transposon TraM protein
MTQNNPNKKQKLLMALPIFLLPAIVIIILIFSLKKPASSSGQIPQKDAFNANLPAPSLHKEEKNKLDIYLQADRDSLKHKELVEKDPYAKQWFNPLPPDDKSREDTLFRRSLSRRYASPNGINTADSNEKKVSDRLQKLYALINPPLDSARFHPYSSPATSPRQNADSAQTARLNHLEAAIRQKDTGGDAQLQQASQVLDKIMDIQHPERVTQRIQAEVSKRPALTVATGPGMGIPNEAADSSSLADNDAEGQADGNRFYGLSEETDAPAPKSNAILAVIHETQTVQTGSTVKLRLLQDIFIGGARIPANSFINGECSISNERLNILLTSIAYNNQVYPISLKAYDTDGMLGIYVPGAITRDAIKEGMSQGISGLGITSFSTSLGAQAASAGIQTAQNLIGRKIRIVQVTLKAGQKVILKNPDTMR